MKNVLILCLIVALMVGCQCTGKDGSKSFRNCIDDAQQKICNFTIDQKTTSGQVLTFLAKAGSIVGPMIVKLASGATITVTPEDALAAFNAIQSAACVGATDLEAALLWFESYTGKTKKLSPLTVYTTPNIDPLWNLIR